MVWVWVERLFEQSPTQLALAKFGVEVMTNRHGTSHYQAGSGGKEDTDEDGFEGHGTW
jgi:hypothetical protein